MELLAPGGDLNKIKYAVIYGADAVYAAGKSFGLRAKSTNLSNEELVKATEFCHSHKRKLYITVNIFAHNEDANKLPEYLEFLQSIKVDALILSDPAVFSLAREFAPEIPIHISTQANVTSWKAAEFWMNLGAKRIILARELTISEIAEIRKKVPEIELEMFVHGAMCMSYSGRCLLSSFLNARSANQGQCTQPCRWEYQLTEKSRPGESFEISEDERGTYIMNSKDLCLIRRLEEIEEAGLTSIKIEGRMKSLYYVANAVRIYKEGLRNIKNNQNLQPELIDELDKISHRHYSEAFFDRFDSAATQFHGSSAYIRNYQFIGEIKSNSGKIAEVAIRAKFQIGEKIEFIFPDRKDDFSWQVDSICDEENNPISFTKPNTTIKITLPKNIPDYGIVRIKL
jgi:U32 family peptidase